MKKVMILALLISGAVCFASNKEGKIETKKQETKESQVLSSKDSKVDTNKAEVECVASCWARISYNGEYVTTIWGSATAGDCVTAQNNCLSVLNLKAKAFIAAAD